MVKLVLTVMIAHHEVTISDSDCMVVMEMIIMMRWIIMMR